MAKIYTCDHCAKEINQMTPIWEVTLQRYNRNAKSISITLPSNELCDDCFKELQQIVTSFCNPMPAKCISCSTHETQKPHSCPYASDIQNNDKVLCNCCTDCEHQCAMDI